MSRNNTGNPIGSKAFPDFEDNVPNLDVAVNSDQDTWRDRLGKSRLTWAGIEKAGSGDPAIAVDAAARAESAASSVEQNAEQIAQDAAQQAASAVIAGVDGHVAAAENAADRAEIAADVAMTAGRVFPTSEAGQGSGGLSSGDYFWVVSGESSETLQLWRKGATSPTDTGKRQPSSVLITALRDKVEGLDEFSSKIDVNEFLSGDFSDLANIPPRRSGSVVVDLTSAQKPLADLGYSRAMQWRSGNDFVKYEVGQDLRGKWVTAGFILWSESADDVSPVNGTTIYGSDGTTLVSPSSQPVLGYIDLGENLRLVWSTRQMPADYAVAFTALWIGSANVPSTSGRFATGFFAEVSSEQQSPDALIYEAIARAKAQNNIDRLNIPVTPSEDFRSLTLTLAGDGNDLSSIHSETLQRSFIAFPAQNPVSAPVRFSMRGDYIGGVLLRDGSDDIAPDHIDGATVGANHGYSAGQATANGHGKVDADCGSVWSDGSETFVLADVISSNTLLLVREGVNTPPAAGTYTHVSGATNTSNIVVTAVTATQWYPPHRDYQMRVYVDGKEVVDRSTQVKADLVQFVESANILARADIIDAWKIDGGMPASWEPDADPSISQTITYTYDKRGQITIARDWLTVKPITVTDYMGLQFGRVGAQTYIIPGAVPFVYQGDTLDYSMGVPADKTLDSGVSIDFDSTMLQSDGEYANRLLAIYPNAVFAMGFLPVGDAAPDVRRDRVSNKAMQIRGNSAKVYFRVLDIGGHISQPGDYYSVIGYRFVLPKSNDRTAFYAVEGGGATWVYADWHNKDGLDRLPIDEQYPELIGRSFEVIEGRNVTAKAGVLAGSLPVIVNAAASSATLILRVQ